MVASKLPNSFLARFSTGSSRNRLETLPSIVSPWESKMHSRVSHWKPRALVPLKVSVFFEMVPA